MLTSQYFYDTEFLETGDTIHLISIGIVHPRSGREYYAVNRQVPWDQVMNHDFLVAEVVPHLPHNSDGSLDFSQMKMKFTIAQEVLAFLLADNEGDDSRKRQLWAWYGAFDHVALAWLWGPMVDMPRGIPWFTRDLKQVHAAQGYPTIPENNDTLHHALADARWNVDLADVLGVLDR